MSSHKNPILIDVPLPIKTPRLTIRDIRPGDGQALYEAKKESLEELKHWMTWAQGGAEGLSQEQDEVLCRVKHAEFIKREDMMMLAFDNQTNAFVAATGFHRNNWQVPSFEIGFWVRSSLAGKGLATELTTALSRYAFEALQARRVSIFHAEGNIGSQRVIEKVGFAYEGLEKNSDPVGAHLYTIYKYAMFDKSDLPELDVSW